jgi:hypothetical protein
MLTVTVPATPSPESATLEAFTNAASAALSDANSTRRTAAATRSARVAGGSPVNVVPFTRDAVVAAARAVAAERLAMAVAVLGPPFAASTAAAIAAAGLAAYSAADMVDETFTIEEN